MQWFPGTRSHLSIDQVGRKWIFHAVNGEWLGVCLLQGVNDCFKIVLTNIHRNLRFSLAAMRCPLGLGSSQRSAWQAAPFVILKWVFKLSLRNFNVYTAQVCREERKKIPDVKRRSALLKHAAQVAVATVRRRLKEWTILALLHAFTPIYRKVKWKFNIRIYVSNIRRIRMSGKWPGSPDSGCPDRISVHP